MLRFLPILADLGGLAGQFLQNPYKRSEHMARATRTLKEASYLTHNQGTFLLPSVGELARTFF